MEAKAGLYMTRQAVHGSFAEYAVNHINTLVHVPDAMSDEEATLAVGLLR